MARAGGAGPTPRGNAQGPAIMLWPGDDQWPGSEMDFGEIANDGSGQYSSLHWDNGGDRYDRSKAALRQGIGAMLSFNKVGGLPVVRKTSWAVSCLRLTF